MESELFGHVKGAFTGAICDRRGRFKQADGGTILLDEIGSLSLSGQAKLLRVLQEHEFEPVGSSVTIPVNVRVVASTNIDLEKATSEGKFREDLYYRLNVFSIPLPPLRERKEDILLLVQHFLGQHSRALGTEIQAVAPQTHTLLIEHDWPGNVRELENAMEHAVIVEKGPVILPSSLPMNLAKSRPAKDDSELFGRDGIKGKVDPSRTADTHGHAVAGPRRQKTYRNHAGDRRKKSTLPVTKTPGGWRIWSHLRDLDLADRPPYHVAKSACVPWRACTRLYGSAEDATRTSRARGEAYKCEFLKKSDKTGYCYTSGYQPNVRFVAHLDLPKSVEAYYQDGVLRCVRVALQYQTA